MLRVGDEEVLLAAPPLLPALGRAVLPFVAAWPAAEPPQCMRDSEQARAGRAQLREARRSTVHVSAPAFPARSWSEGGAGEAHQHVDVAARSATQRFDAEIAAEDAVRRKHREKRLAAAAAAVAPVVDANASVAPLQSHITTGVPISQPASEQIAEAAPDQHQHQLERARAVSSERVRRAAETRRLSVLEAALASPDAKLADAESLGALRTAARDVGAAHEALEKALARLPAGAGGASAALDSVQAAAAAAAAAGVPSDDPLILRAKTCEVALQQQAAAPSVVAPALGPGARSAAGVGSGAAEWEAAKAAAASSDALQARAIATGGAAMASVRRVGALVGQVACEHYTVWSKATALVDELGRLRALGEEALHAGCGALAAKLVQQGAMMVEKSPGIAYALAGVALAVGEAEPLVWACLRDRLCAACCYVAPCYVKRPEGASNDEWKRAMGYKARADGRTLEKKEAYYNRMGAYMSMWAALLQASAVPTFPRTNGANDSTMLVRPANNPLGVGAAWSWLARLLNAPPQRITAALLYPFLHGCAHSLAATYRRQFPKLLHFLNGAYLPKVRALLDGVDPGLLAEEIAAITLLEAWTVNALKDLAAGRPLAEPAASHMVEVKAPDDTRDADWD